MIRGDGVSTRIPPRVFELPLSPGTRGARSENAFAGRLRTTSVAQKNRIQKIKEGYRWGTIYLKKQKNWKLGNIGDTCSTWSRRTLYYRLKTVTILPPPRPTTTVPGCWPAVGGGAFFITPGGGGKRCLLQA